MDVDGDSHDEPVVNIGRERFSFPAIPAAQGRPLPDIVGGPIDSNVVRNPSMLVEPHRRRVGFGVGRVLVSEERVREMDGCVGLEVDKCTGTSGHFSSALPLVLSPVRQSCDGLHGQCDGGSRNKEEGLGEVSPSVENTGTDNIIMFPPEDHSTGETCGGIPQRSRGQLVQDNSSAIRVVSPDGQVQGDMFLVGNASSGSLCHSIQQQNANFRVSSSDSGPSGLPDRVVGSVVSDVRLPTQQAASRALTQGPQDEIRPASHSHLSVMAQEVMVSLHSAIDRSRSCASQSSSSSPVPSGSRDDGVSCEPCDFKSSRSTIIRRELIRRQWNDATVSVVDQSLRPQSSAVYERFWAEFMSFASSRVSHITDISLGLLTSFLHHLAFSRKLQLSTIKSYVSAIKFPLELVLKQDITASPAYDKFMRGLANLMPVRRVPPVSWNLEVVLAHLRRLEPMRSLSPVQLRAKCLFLVAVASGKRVSELTHLGWDEPFLHFSKCSASLIYIPEFLAKTENPTSLHSPLIINSISSSAPDQAEKFVCPVRALHYWRAHIRSLPHKDPLQLFQHPSGARASVREVSKTLVDLIKSSHAGLDDADARLLCVKAHDIRAVAASRVWSLRPSWSDLASAFNWRNKNVFISIYARGISALKSIRSD